MGETDSFGGGISLSGVIGDAGANCLTTLVGGLIINDFFTLFQDTFTEINILIVESWHFSSFFFILAQILGFGSLVYWGEYDITIDFFDEVCYN